MTGMLTQRNTGPANTALLLFPPQASLFLEVRCVISCCGSWCLNWVWRRAVQLSSPITSKNMQAVTLLIQEQQVGQLLVCLNLQFGEIYKIKKAKIYSKLGCLRSRRFHLEEVSLFLQWIIWSGPTSFMVWDTWEQENGLLIQFPHFENHILRPGGRVWVFFPLLYWAKCIRVIGGEERKCVHLISLSEHNAPSFLSNGLPLFPALSTENTGWFSNTDTQVFKQRNKGQFAKAKARPPPMA